MTTEQAEQLQYIYDKAIIGTTLIDCGTSTTFNVTDYYTGDYTKLTVNNFIITIESISGSTSGTWKSSSGDTMSKSATSNISTTYDSTTGKFTLSGNKVSMDDWRSGDATKRMNSSATAKCRIYLIP